MKTKIENKVRMMGGVAIADYTDKAMAKNNGVLTSANLKAIEAAKNGMSEMVALSGRLHSILHMDTMERNMANFSKFGGDIKAIELLPNICKGMLDGISLKRSCRLIPVLVKWASNESKKIPVHNGSFGKLFDTHKTNLFQIMGEHERFNASSYDVSGKGYEFHLSTILRQSGLAKDMMYLLGLIAEDGTIRLDSGIFKAFQKRYN